VYCPQCRSELPDDAKYCIKCGYDFARIKTPPSRKAPSDSLDNMETLIGQEIDTSSFTKGNLFANRYEILDEGKKGGMGAVYKVKDTKLHEVIALKIIHPRLTQSNQALQRFRQEVAISRKLNHEHIVKVYNLEEWENKEYFTMEWVEGVTLRDILIERKRENKSFSLEEAYKIISQLCDALHYAHHYTVHRDIKPENILVYNLYPSLAKEGKGGFFIKLTDFGIAKILSPSQFTSTSMQMGTPYYMAPEQKLDAGNVDKRADIYALGVVLFELLTLSNTIGLKLPSQIRRDIPKEIDDLLVKALEEEPDDRYKDAKEFSDLLGQIVDRRDLMSEEARQRKAEEEKNRKAEEERKRKETEETEKKRQDAKRQKAAAEEKAKIEAEKKALAVETERVEREKKKIEEDDRQRWLQEEAQKKKSPALMIGVAIAVIVCIFIISQQNRSVEPPVPVEAPIEAPKAIAEPTPIQKSATPTISVPEAVEGKWSAVVLTVEDKTTNESSDFTVNLNSYFIIPNSNLKVMVGEFLPDFQMKGFELTSKSNEPNMPAVGIKVFENGKQIFPALAKKWGWLYAKFPTMQPIEHPRYGIVLKEGIRR